jgi:hypothetical protein
MFRRLASVWHAAVLLTLSVSLLTYRTLKESTTKVHWIVMSTSKSPGLEKLQDMAHRHGETIQVLNQEPSLSEFTGLLNSATFSGNDIVIFSDAHSVIQVSSRAAIRKRFLMVGKPIVVAAQDTPTFSGCPCRESVLYPFSHINPKVCMGRVWALRKLLADRSASANEPASFVRACQRHPDLISVDHHGSLLFTHSKQNKAMALEWNPTTHRCQCRGTGTQPLIVQTSDSVLPMYAALGV